MTDEAKTRLASVETYGVGNGHSYGASDSHRNQVSATPEFAQIVCTHPKLGVELNDPGKIHAALEAGVEGVQANSIREAVDEITEKAMKEALDWADKHPATVTYQDVHEPTNTAHFDFFEPPSPANSLGPAFDLIANVCNKAYGFEGGTNFTRER